MHNRLNRILLAALFSAGAMTSQVAGAAENCTDLTKPGLFPNTAYVESAVVVAADAKTGMPSFCELRVFIFPVPNSLSHAVYRLPDNWNGRMLGLGGGGYSGHTLLRSLFPIPGPGRFADLGLTRGYATAQTDAGHRMSPFSADVSWMRDNPEAITDFSHRAIHEMTVLGKQVVASYYGRAATKNYFQGCSTGGRMGLMEAQRYPDDYDGVVAGAPVYDLLTQTGAMVRDQIFKAPGAAISDEQLKLVNDAVLAVCDAEDGLKDGVLTDPRRCSWEPKSLQCAAGDAAGTCLVPSQVEALDKAYRTVRTRAGIVGNYGLTRGSEVGWRPNLLTGAGPRHALNGDLTGLTVLMFGSSAFDPAKFDIETQQAAVHQTPFAAEYEASSADLSKFVGRGGKLLLWHGLDDSGPSPFGTVDYYERAVKASGGDNLRLFALPGVYHCAGGPGAHTFDPLTALEQWVESGIEPDSMVATNSSGLERPVCAWPKLPYYESGEPAKATSFVCR
jgi:feruloyl esterase